MKYSIEISFTHFSKIGIDNSSHRTSKQGMVWNGKWFFHIPFQQLCILFPFHTKDLPFHSKIFFHILFHTSTPRNVEVANFCGSGSGGRVLLPVWPFVSNLNVVKFCVKYMMKRKCLTDHHYSFTKKHF